MRWAGGRAVGRAVEQLRGDESLTSAAWGAVANPGFGCARRRAAGDQRSAGHRQGLPAKPGRSLGASPMRRPSCAFRPTRPKAASDAGPSPHPLGLHPARGAEQSRCASTRNGPGPRSGGGRGNLVAGEISCSRPLTPPAPPRRRSGPGPAGGRIRPFSQRRPKRPVCGGCRRLPSSRTLESFGSSASTSFSTAASDRSAAGAVSHRPGPARLRQAPGRAPMPRRPDTPTARPRPGAAPRRIENPASSGERSSREHLAFRHPGRTRARGFCNRGDTSIFFVKQDLCFASATAGRPSRVVITRRPPADPGFRSSPGCLTPR
jgi:hypothetical protein